MMPCRRASSPSRRRCGPWRSRCSPRSAWRRRRRWTGSTVIMGKKAMLQWMIHGGHQSAAWIATVFAKNRFYEPFSLEFSWNRDTVCRTTRLLRQWRDARVADWDGLENRYRVTYPGFESQSLRQFYAWNVPKFHMRSHFGDFYAHTLLC